MHRNIKEKKNKKTRQTNKQLVLINLINGHFRETVMTKLKSHNVFSRTIQNQIENNKQSHFIY